jgi:TonB-linked SusC/RagA family outer membrane protein
VNYPRCLIMTAAIAAAASFAGSPHRAAAQATAPPGDAIVTGVVTAAGGNPVNGATVAIVSLRLGATTREDGHYTFTVPASNLNGQPVTITARSIGYKAQTVDVTLAAGANTQNFTLETTPLQLGEIVVTGEGTTATARELATARGSVTDSAILKSNEPNITTALAAKAPGVQVTSTSGDPGSSTQIVIRGINTLGGGANHGDGKPSDPLFIVDGVPIDNSSITPSFLDPQASAEGGAASPNRAVDINPDDIAHIEILKGAAAGAIYGARAGQGVIIITTKHGNAGQTHYSLNSSYSIDSPNRYVPLQNLFGQGSAGQPDPCAEGQQGLDCTASPFSWGAPLAKGTKVYDHSNEMFTTGNTINNTLTASGGNERTTFYMSGSYITQSGTVVGPNDYLKRSSLRLSADHRLFDKLRIGGNITVAETNQGGVQKGFNFSSVTWTSYMTPPEFNNRPYLSPSAGLQRSYIDPFPSNASALESRGFDNPFWTAFTAVSTSNDPRTLGDIHAQYDPLSWLKVTYQLGFDNSNDSRLQGQGQSNSNSLSPAGQVLTLDFDHNTVNQDVVATATYARGDKLTGSLALGSNLESQNVYENGLIGDGLLTPGLYSLNNVSSVRSPLTMETHQRVEGFFAQDRLDLLDQVFLQGGLRYDGASTYSPGNLWALFPSASAAWEFTKATGTVGPISYGKLRAAYGEVGTQPSPYLYEAEFQSTREFTNGYGGLFVSPQGIGGLTLPQEAPAVNLRPERTGEAEGGFDLGLFGDLADLNFTLYRRRSTDVILATPVAASTGFTQQFANGATIQNQGGELGINIRPITRKDLKWTVGLSGSVNHNDVLSLLGAPFVTYGGSGGFGIAFATVGNSVDAFRDLDYVRCGRGITLFTSGGAPYSVDAHCSSAQRKGRALFISNGGLVTAAGDPGDGPGFPLIDPTARTIGNPDPKWNASINNQLTIGKLALSALVDIRRGGLVYNGTAAVLNFYGTGAQTARRGQQVVFGQTYLPGFGSQKGMVAGPGAGTKVTLDQNWFQNYDGGVSPAPIGAPFYEDGSFTKLREVSATYEFVSPAISRLGLNSVSLRVSGRNLFVWTRYAGSDPEVNDVGAETGAHGVDYFGDPQTRSVIFTVILNK